MKSVKTIILICIAFIVVSCTDNSSDMLPSEPSYGPLSMSTLQSVQTPYQDVFNPGKVTNGRLANDDLEAVKEKLAEIFPEGKIDDIEEDEERGIDVWEIEVYINEDDDDEIEFYISKDLLEVVKIDGDGPIDYEINPGGDFILLSEAVQAADQAVNGIIDDWELEYDNSKWIYEFEYETNQDDDVEVMINAFTGDLIGIYADDYDDDDDDDEDDDDDDEDDDDDDDDENDDNDDD